eukprot:TRINITY_DN24168_c0_g2_i1.p1 TRINITY_DN24168_c0_g2~~TRINITY_DN24168_c0_g2_i1.p1  ORF type:complete len:469 (+),score=49.66 TRINITY_DN24168_c0_g2_i1:62-1468(+)
MASLEQKILHVTGLPASITVEELAVFFTREFGPLRAGRYSASDGITNLALDTNENEHQEKEPRSRCTEGRYGINLHNKGKRAPHCYVVFREDVPADLTAQAVERCAANKRYLMKAEGWTAAEVRLKTGSKQNRVQDIEASATAKLAREAEREARRPPWCAELLERFPSRESTMCQHVQMSELSAELRGFVSLYIVHRFPHSHAEVSAALNWVSENYPKSLRIKELFETVEVFALIVQQLDMICSGGLRERSRTAAAAGRSLNSTKSKDEAVPPPPPVIDTVFDMACGHGLLGVLLAYRFPALHVVCVDLHRRAAFDQYVAALKASSAPCQDGSEEPLSNIEFLESDIADVVVPPRSFIACIHACNEANKIAVDLAQQSQAGFAAMPCCIPDKLYSVQHIRYADREMRYAAMVGVMAGTYEAHSIACIDRRITDRHMCIFGGYPFAGRDRLRTNTFRTHRDHRSFAHCR